jgi:hypothetical protein
MKRVRWKRIAPTQKGAMKFDRAVGARLISPRGRLPAVMTFDRVIGTPDLLIFVDLPNAPLSVLADIYPFSLPNYFNLCK